MSNIQLIIILIGGGLFCSISIGTFWSTRQKTHQPEKNLLLRLMYRFAILGAFIVCVPLILFMLKTLFGEKPPSSIYSLYMLISGALGMLLFIWNVHDIILIVPGRARDTYPSLRFAIILSIMCGFFYLFLYQGLVNIAKILFVFVNISFIHMISFSFTALILILSFIYIFILLKRHRGGRSIKDWSLW